MYISYIIWCSKNHVNRSLHNIDPFTSLTFQRNTIPVANKNRSNEKSLCSTAFPSHLKGKEKNDLVFHSLIQNYLLTRNKHQVLSRDGLVGRVCNKSILMKYCDEILKLPLHLSTYLLEGKHKIFKTSQNLKKL